jgi:histone acetyltransferase 1
VSSLFSFAETCSSAELNPSQSPAALYSKVYQHCLDRPLVAELTIEDPSEAFEDLRDVCDLRMLERLLRPGSSSSLASSLDIRGPPKPKRELEEIRRSLKLAGRQFARLYEMLLMFGLREGDSEAAKKLRLFVKERLYRFNYVSGLQGTLSWWLSGFC